MIVLELSCLGGGLPSLSALVYVSYSLKCFNCLTGHIRVI